MINGWGIDRGNNTIVLHMNANLFDRSTADGLRGQSGPIKALISSQIFNIWRPFSVIL